MVDRQDIDALLIGSLYGELSSTEEARLAAHLESHPADRTALADLTRARAVVRESRILQVQFEPPQSISALLMQEAVRRAPKPREEMNWFQRFMRSVLLHPAMAAAAMLVLIIGVAGTMYLKQGDQYVGPKKAPAPEITTSNAAGDQTAMLPPATTTADAPTAAPTDQYQVALDDGAGGKMADRSEDEKSLADKGKQVAAAETKKAQLESQLALESRRREVAKNEKAEVALAKESAAAKQEPPKAAEEQPVAKKAKPSKGYIEVTTPDQRPKDFEGNTTVAGRGDASKQDSVASNRPGGGAVPKAPASGSTAPTTPMPAPPPPAENKPADAKPDPMLAWAKEQHGKAIVAAKKDCKLAASIVTQISNRAPAYYSANIENDRALKSCQQYIAQEREKELERANRAKATQKRAVDEAPAPAPTTTK
jgi:hypothetical protein